MREMSKKNPYWIEKNRKKELMYFCRQYPIWQKALAAITGLQQRPEDLEVFVQSGQCSDPTAKAVEAREKYNHLINMVKEAAITTDEELADYIIYGACFGMSYDELWTFHKIPCCRQKYYELYAKFFWVLNKLRD